MTTSHEDFADASTLRRRFLQAVVSARPPIRARNLTVPGLDRKTIQKRLERLRHQAGEGGADDDTLFAYAQAELSQLAGPVNRGLRKLAALADPEALRFATAAGIQATVIGDWVELAHSPGDRGWTRSQISVQEVSRRSLFLRGKAQSWLAEKKAFLKECWARSRLEPELRRDLTPNLLKMDLAGVRAYGTEDSPACSIQLAAVDWLTCFALNSRLNSLAKSGTGSSGQTVRERWAQPAAVAARRALPGMIVAHIIVETVDKRFLVCQRQASGLRDELGTWSLSIEERWSGSVGASNGDLHPHDVVRRALREELGVRIKDEGIRVLSWGLEASVLYPGFIAIASIPFGSWEMEGLRANASDANELRFVTSVPADLDSLQILDEAHFSPSGAETARGRWHRTAKARLFAALAHLQALSGEDTRDSLLRYLGDRHAKA